MMSSKGLCLLAVIASGLYMCTAVADGNGLSRLGGNGLDGISRNAFERRTDNALQTSGRDVSVGKNAYSHTSDSGLTTQGQAVEVGSNAFSTTTKSGLSNEGRDINVSDNAYDTTTDNALASQGTEVTGGSNGISGIGKSVTASSNGLNGTNGLSGGNQLDKLGSRAFSTLGHRGIVSEVPISKDIDFIYTPTSNAFGGSMQQGRQLSGQNSLNPSNPLSPSNSLSPTNKLNPQNTLDPENSLNYENTWVGMDGSRSGNGLRDMPGIGDSDGFTNRLEELNESRDDGWRTTRTAFDGALKITPERVNALGGKSAF